MSGFTLKRDSLEVYKLRKRPSKLNPEDIEVVVSIEGYTDEEVRRVTLDLCNSNQDILDEYLEWLSVYRVDRALAKGINQGYPGRLVANVDISGISRAESTLRSRWLDKVEAVIPYVTDSQIENYMEVESAESSVRSESRSKN